MVTRRYTITASNYVRAVNIPANCADIDFINAGTSTLIVQNVPIGPGLQLSISANENEEDVTNYSISFTGAGVNSAFVVKKVYV